MQKKPGMCMHMSKLLDGRRSRVININGEKR